MVPLSDAEALHAIQHRRIRTHGGELRSPEGCHEGDIPRNAQAAG
jgi:hypothetical protein